MKNKTVNLQSAFILALGMLITGVFNTAKAHEQNINSLDANTQIRSPVTHGFWFQKLVTFGEEWYRGRLIEQDSHNETGELPDASDPDGHQGFTAINATRWLIGHHWFGDDEVAEEQLYSRNPNWFFDSNNPSNSVMGIFAMFRWGLLNEAEARLAIHNMIKSYADREYSILLDGVWIYAMSDLSSTDFTINDGSRAVPNPLALSEEKAIRYEIGVIMTHHFFGRNRNNTVRTMDKIYDRLVSILQELNNNTITDKDARLAIVRLVRGK